MGWCWELGKESRDRRVGLKARLGISLRDDDDDDGGGVI